MTVWLDPHVAALLLGVSRSRVYVLASQGRVPGAVMQGGRWRFDRALVEPWAADHKLRERARVARNALLAEMRNSPHPP